VFLRAYALNAHRRHTGIPEAPFGCEMERLPVGKLKTGSQRLDARGSANLVVALRLRSSVGRQCGLSGSPTLFGRN